VISVDVLLSNRVINQMTMPPAYNLSCLRRIWGDGGDPCQDVWSDRQQWNGNEAYGKRPILHFNTSSSNIKATGSDDDDIVMMTMIKRPTLAWETNSLSWSKKTSCLSGTWKFTQTRPLWVLRQKFRDTYKFVFICGFLKIM